MTLAFSNKKKLFLLFLILALPISLFLFFFLFGENKFDVPIYHQEQSATIPAMCDEEYYFPYTVPYSSHLTLQGITLIAFMKEMDKEQRSDLNFYLDRLLTSFTRNTVHWVSVYTQPDKISYLMKSNRAVLLDLVSYDREKSCCYLAAGYDLALVDARRRIRGYYQATSLDELDRLGMELKILSKKQ